MQTRSVPARQAALPVSPIWVVEESSGSGAHPAVSVAGRLGLPFRRIGVDGPGGRVRPGSAPMLIVSSGLRGAMQALLLRQRHGGVAVHCLHAPPTLPTRLVASPFDLLVLPTRASTPERPPGSSARLLPTLGPLHPVSPGLLAQARMLWAERLSHLPWPRITVLLGADAPNLREIVGLGRRLAGVARALGGSVLAATLPGCPRPMQDALSAGLGECLHLFYRAGEPGDDPTLGFLGGADAIVAAWTTPQALSEACAADGPVFLVRRPPDGRSGLAEQLLTLDLVRNLDAGQDLLAPWPRSVLDESGRVARLILRRFPAMIDRSLEPDPADRA